MPTIASEEIQKEIGFGLVPVTDTKPGVQGHLLTHRGDMIYHGIIVKNIAVVRRPDGTNHLQFPAKPNPYYGKDENGKKYLDVVFPVSKDIREKIESALNDYLAF